MDNECLKEELVRPKEYAAYAWLPALSASHAQTRLIASSKGGSFL
jgi:hypothetical protein